MSFTVFLGNLPIWVTADEIKQWLSAEDLVADSVKVIRNHETQESKGFAFVEAPTADEMQAIIRRFDRAPLEDKLLRANPAQPSKGKGQPVNGVSAPLPANPAAELARYLEQVTEQATGAEPGAVQNAIGKANRKAPSPLNWPKLSKRVRFFSNPALFHPVPHL